MMIKEEKGIFKKLIKPTKMEPIEGYPGLYRTKVSLPSSIKMEEFKNELIRNASNPTLAQLLEKELLDL